MKRSVQIYIEGERIELFNDEEIQVNSSVQNINDLDKVKTDFSQSFTVPASPINNAIFQHFYQNEVNSTLNYSSRRDAYIEIDNILFRKGKVQLEKSDIKNLATDSYTITFYGEVTKLKDQFGEDKLSMLDYSAYSHVYSGAEILNRITDLGMDYDVRYPLISSRRVWQYNEPTTPLDNIDTNTGRIDYTELFPSLKVEKIFEAIQSTYGVTFEGSWLQSEQFQKLFLMCKNTNQFTFLTPSERVDITNDINTSSFVADSVSNFISYPFDYNLFSSGGTILYHVLTFRVLSVTTFDDYYIDVYKNGVLVNTISGSGVNDYYVETINTSAFGVQTEMYFEVKASAELTITCDLYNEYYGGSATSAPTLQQTYVVDCAPVVMSGDVNLSTNMPDIKVADFVSGIIKQFNLTLYPVSDNRYYLEPLEDWYARGTIYDITEYTTTDDIEVKRVPLYKKIDFNYQKSESFMNNAFLRFFNRAYANLNYNFNVDANDYTIQVPFEQPLFNKFTDTNIQVGYFLKDSPNYEPYVPKPVLLYYNGMIDIVADDFKFDDGFIIYNVGNYALFGQDLRTQNGDLYSLCWGSEVSSYYQQVIDMGVYKTYYSNYLQNLYNNKNRLVTVKTVLPLRILTDLNLNDRLIIRDKRYVINDMKSNLVNGEVTFTLLHDFRALRRTKFIQPSIDVNTVVVGVNVMDGAVSGDIDITGTGVISVTPNTFTTDTIVTFELPPFTGGLFNVVGEDATFISDESGEDTLINEDSSTDSFEIPVNYTFTDGSTDTEYILISRA
jgi:hypothetical protein